MNKFWSLLFLAVPVLGVATFVVGPYFDIWLPKDISEHGRNIDDLFYFILWLTGVVFIITEIVLFYFLWKYSDHTEKHQVKYTHGSHTLEVIWTIIPAATLLFLAIYQMDAWAAAKMRPPAIPPTAEVLGRQFEWRFRYPGEDGELHTADDVHDVMELRVPVGEEVLLVIKSEDVLHSFFLPNLRVKQDIVPGMKQAVWFKASEEGEFDIVCAELCGWGHYKMKGRLIVMNPIEYKSWLAKKYEQQQTKQEPSASADKG